MPLSQDSNLRMEAIQHGVRTRLFVFEDTQVVYKDFYVAEGDEAEVHVEESMAVAELSEAQNPYQGSKTTSITSIGGRQALAWINKAENKMMIMRVCSYSE